MSTSVPRSTSPSSCTELIAASGRVMACGPSSPSGLKMMRRMRRSSGSSSKPASRPTRRPASRTWDPSCSSIGQSYVPADSRATVDKESASRSTTLAEFKATLSSTTPPAVPPLLVALWHDARGDWEQAHRVAQDDRRPDGAWVHAYLHRKEGDPGNAAYWYRQGGSAGGDRCARCGMGADRRGAARLKRRATQQKGDPERVALQLSRPGRVATRSLRCSRSCCTCSTRRCGS